MVEFEEVPDMQELNWGSLGVTATTWAADQILEVILIAQENGHDLVPEVHAGEAHWFAKCSKCDQAALVRFAAVPDQFGGVQSTRLSEPCGLAQVKKGMGVALGLKELVEIK
jgi:hypothetical protein